MISTERLEEIRRKTEAASPAPWVVEPCHRCDQIHVRDSGHTDAMTVIEYGPDLPLKTAREARIWSEAQAEMRERCAKVIETAPGQFGADADWTRAHRAFLAGTIRALR
jgi:hypothetical protein